MPRVVYGLSHSENGWPMVNADECEWTKIPGTSVTLQIAKGQPLAILRAFAADFHAYVEPLRDADSACWTPTNSVPSSNHLSGTAMDLNWNSHPFKVSYAGFDETKIATMRELLAFYEGTVFWGQDWNSPKDPMHAQCGYNTYGNPKTADFIARKIRADGYSTFRRGSAPASAAPILAAATGLSEARAAEILPAVRSGLRESECTNVNRIAMWLAQIGHESGSFQYTEEIAKNGRYAPYIGRTWIQITWDYNYRSFSQWAYAFGMVPTPDYFVVNYRELADLKWAGIGPAWYWTVARPDINELSDRRDLNTVTRRINGGTNGLADRQARYNRALAQGDALLQLLHEEDDFLSALTDAEQRELLDLARQQAKYKRKSRSPLHWPHEGEVDTIAGLSWSTDANVHIQLVEKLAVIYGDPVSIALLYAVSNSDDPTNNPELAKRILKRVKPEDITAAQVQIQKWLAAEQKFHAA
ncbi:lysin A [Mycobacterium phage Snazzy]|uniref:Lysin A n=3 Tax=Fromanvirus TaxID=186764 RepID=G8IB48_9CAUD|nr:endolysin [Mycobacterium phage Violet]YP_009013465.1 endolysin [Mycobacterium phage Kugel]YP_009019086.1 endolysin [Mycobacterium phage SkiPole]QDP44744.1 lysin A [Mycobacterium phage Ajay]QFG12945.1 lysin A [Mycobacterium phage Paphu]QGJ89808.1 lysin A [Mycobacterium phage Snazzy]ADA83737.1 lysin A [Mycobacterium phage SkiPole]AEO94451.1 lysin A [Mycobacterium phage Violet]